MKISVHAIEAVKGAYGAGELTESWDVDELVPAIKSAVAFVEEWYYEAHTKDLSAEQSEDLHRALSEGKSWEAPGCNFRVSIG